MEETNLPKIEMDPAEMKRRLLAAARGDGPPVPVAHYVAPANAEPQDDAVRAYMSGLHIDDRARERYAPLHDLPEAHAMTHDGPQRVVHAPSRAFLDAVHRQAATDATAAGISTRDPAHPYWATRTRVEHRELCERITTLMAFIGDSPAYRALDEEDRDLLRAQRDAMLAYERALNARIKRHQAAGLADAAKAAKVADTANQPASITSFKG